MSSVVNYRCFLFTEQIEWEKTQVNQAAMTLLKTIDDQRSWFNNGRLLDDLNRGCWSSFYLRLNDHGPLDYFRFCDCCSCCCLRHCGDFLNRFAPGGAI